MNRDEAKDILLLHRPGTADADDPQIAEALALAKQDAQLARWLEEQSARQQSLRAKFRQITAPSGLQQIISESAAFSSSSVRRRTFTAALAVAAIVVSLMILMPFWLPRRTAPENMLANYKTQMASVMLRGYAMDTNTSDPKVVRAYLAKNQAPADYALPAGLQKVAVTGCAIEGWQNAKVSMICFRTGKSLPPGQQSDLWLFVVDRASLPDAPPPGPPQVASVDRLITAVWSQGDKVYFLGTEGESQAISQFL
jgi:hypothetical protein